jgi:hypothetical protein
MPRFSNLLRPRQIIDGWATAFIATDIVGNNKSMDVLILTMKSPNMSIASCVAFCETVVVSELRVGSDRPTSES